MTGSIGQAAAHALSEAGFTVVGTSRNGDAGATLDGAGVAALDVAHDQCVRTLVADVVAKLGRIDALINDAGVGLAGAAEEASIEQVQTTFDINVTCMIRGTNPVLPHMRASNATATLCVIRLTCLGNFAEVDDKHQYESRR